MLYSKRLKPISPLSSSSVGDDRRDGGGTPRPLGGAPREGIDGIDGGGVGAFFASLLLLLPLLLISSVFSFFGSRLGGGIPFFSRSSNKRPPNSRMLSMLSND
jgi:hypothetical protein